MTEELTRDEELTHAEIDDWLSAHDMVILARHHDYIGDGVLRMVSVCLYHRDTETVSWANQQFIRRVANSDAETGPLGWFQ